MKIFKYLTILISLLLTPVISFAAQQNFIAGKDYQIIQNAPAQKKTGEVQVIEFFSYGCPGCYHFEPILKSWLATKPQYVVFERSPVIFHQGWDVYARAYFVAKAMNVLDKIHQPLFDAIHQQNQTLADEQSMANFFAKQGVDKQDFISRYEFMPLIGAQLEKSEKAFKDYGVFEVPTLVIAGKYRTNINMVKGDAKRFFAVLNYLVEKEHKS